MEPKDWLIIDLDGSWRVVQATDMYTLWAKESNSLGNLSAIIAVDTLRDCFDKACWNDGITIDEKVIEVTIYNDGDGYVDSDGPSVNHKGFEKWIEKMLESNKPKS